MTHWAARAFLLFTVVSGCLSVYYSCVLQRTIGKLYKPSLIRDFLQQNVEGGADEERRTSLAAVILVSAPFAMIQISILAFVVGLAIYQGFTWTRKLDMASSQNDSRYVFVTFMIGTLYCYCFFEFSFLGKNIENFLLKKRRRVSTNPEKSQTKKTEPSGSGQAVLQNHPQLHPSRSADGLLGRDLATALRAAALAHVQCAEADRRVAAEYERMARSSVE